MGEAEAAAATAGARCRSRTIRLRAANELERLALVDEALEDRRARPSSHAASTGGRVMRIDLPGAGSATTTSPSPTSTSWSFSPGAGADELDRDLDARAPCRRGGSSFSARSSDLHGLAHVEHVDLAAPADRAGLTTSCTASGIVMKKRVISGCVTVTGPPRAICRRKIGITEPDEPSTLPKRTRDEPRRRRRRGARTTSTIHSQSAFDCPITVFGFAALSVETSTKRFAPNSTATSATRPRARACCCAPPRAGSPPSSARACRRPRGRRRRAGTSRRPGASSPRRRTSASDRRRGAGSRARRTSSRSISNSAGSRVVDEHEPRRRRAARAGGRARSRSSRRRR